MISILLFIISTALALFSGVLLNSAVRYFSLPGWFLGSYIFTSTSIVLPLLISGLVNQFNPAGVLLAQGIFFLFSLFVWQKLKKPHLFPELPSLSWNTFSISPLYAVFIIGIGLTIVINGILSVVVPQNNFDAMTYHLARIGYWIQHQSLLPWETPNFRQVAWPFNAELLAAQSVLFLHSDRLTGLVQWFSYIFGILLVYSFARLMQSSRLASLFAALVWSTFPLVVLESSTTQNDLVVAVFFLVSVYFYLLGWKKENTSNFIPAGLALGLALGTKLTAIFALPGLFLVTLFLAGKNLSKNRKKLIILGAWFTIGLALLGSFTYLQDLFLYRYPFGPSELGTGSSANLQGGPVKWKYFLLTYLYHGIDFSGFPQPISNFLNPIKRDIGWRVFNKLNFSSCGQMPPYSPYQILGMVPRLHEDFSGFGAISFSFLPISSVIFIIEGWRKKNFVFWVLFTVGITYTLIIIFQGWTPHRHRYFILGVTALAPSISWWFSRPKWAFILGSLALMIACNTTLFNESKPLMGDNAIWGKDHLDLRTKNHPITYPLFQAFEKEVPSKSKVALFLGKNGYDRLFFGEFFDRQVFQSDPYIQGDDISWLFENKIDYLVVGPLQRFFVTLPDGLEPIFESNNGSLYRINASYSSSTFKKADSYTPLIYNVSDSLESQIQIFEEWIGTLEGGYAWNIEEDFQGAYAWIGQCSAQGFWANIWANGYFRVKIQVQIEPGPSRFTPLRSVVGIGADENNTIRWKSDAISFESPAEISWLVSLEPGLNKIGVYTLEPPNTLQLPNGDTRPLLARIREIRIESP